MRLVLKPKADPDETFDSTVVAFYASGNQDDLDNLLNMLDNFFDDCYNHPDTGHEFRQPSQVSYFFNQNVHTTLKPEDMNVKTEFKSDGSELPVPFYAAGPPWGARQIAATLDFQENELHVIFSGNLYPLRRSFDTTQTGGNYAEPDEEGRK